jgi:hypothetical protein
MDHAAHEPGTVQECPDCRAFAYEPGWYRSLREEHSSGRVPLVIPEAGVKVVIPEAAQHLDVVVPELEDVRREDDER